MDKTIQQFDRALGRCRDLFAAKLNDYGPSWRMMRPSTITDQLYIKAKRIRSLETKGVSMVGEGILPEFIAMVNYGIIGLIQLELGYSDVKDISFDEAQRKYDEWMQKARTLMIAKNHDYDEAWRSMRVSSYTDFILTKLMRIMEIEGNGGATSVSEGVDSNYMDIINYSVFGIIKLTEGDK